LQFDDFPGQTLLRGVPAIDDHGKLHAWLLSVDRRLRPRYLAGPLAEVRSLIQVLNAAVELGSVPRWSIFRQQLGKAGGGSATNFSKKTIAQGWTSAPL